MRSKLLLFIFLSIFLLNKSISANEIDKLKTNEDVQDFVRKQDDRFKDFLVLDKWWNYAYGQREDSVLKQHLSDSLQIKTWQKVDFNHDGLIDLLVNGIWHVHSCTVVFVDEGKTCSSHYLTRGYFSSAIFLTVDSVQHQVVVVSHKIHSQTMRTPTNQTFPQSDTLLYKFGEFIEYNSHPTQYTIKKIDCSTSGCFGECPIFSLSISPDRNATYDAIRFNLPDGKFTGLIDTSNFNQLTELINYIDFKHLHDKYSVNWTDDQTITTTITYEDGETKTIVDYGKIGTYGLALLYKKLFALRKNQNWKAKK